MVTDGDVQEKNLLPLFLIICRWEGHGSEIEHRNCSKCARANCVSLTEEVPNQKTTRNINSYTVSESNISLRFRWKLCTSHWKKKQLHCYLIFYFTLDLEKISTLRILSQGKEFPGIFIFLICQAVKSEESWQVTGAYAQKVFCRKKRVQWLQSVCLSWDCDRCTVRTIDLGIRNRENSKKCIIGSNHDTGTTEGNRICFNWLS